MISRAVVGALPCSRSFLPRCLRHAIEPAYLAISTPSRRHWTNLYHSPTRRPLLSNSACRLGIPRRAHTRAPTLHDDPHEAAKKPATLLPPSEDQQRAIDTLLHSKNNLIIDACAGSGKTTTILHLASSAPNDQFLVLVYNRRLMVETEERVQALGLRNVTVLNYHTLGVRYYTSECATDQGLKRVVEDDMPVVDGMVLPDFSVLVMDEQQDMTPILKRFVDKLIRDKGHAARSNHPPRDHHHLRIVVLGDRRQELYGFNNADSRFLTMAARPEVFGYVNREAWTSIDLTTSRRLTQQNVDFINQQMLKMPPALAMRAVKNQDENGNPYPRPRYVICNPTEGVVGEVLRLLDSGDLSPADIIILAPSVRGSSAAISLGNALALKDVPVFRSDSDHSDVDPEVARGKILICTYHQAKGIERRAAIVLGFDQDYHTLYAKVSDPPAAANNPQYVAATRAVEHLILIHNHERAALPFVRLESIEESCDLVMARGLDIEESEPRPGPRLFGVTALCRNLSETLITACLQHLAVHSVVTPAYGVEPSPPTVVQDKYGLLESTPAITGTAITAIYEWQTRKRLTMLGRMGTFLDPKRRKRMSTNPLRKLPQKYYEKLQMVQDAHSNGVATVDDILFLSTWHMANMEGDLIKLLAIPFENYGWLSEEHCNDMRTTFNQIPPPAHLYTPGIFFEDAKYRKYHNAKVGGSSTSSKMDKDIVITGAMDMFRPGREPRGVWEVKYAMSLQPEHVLQVALYMWMLGSKAPVSGFLVSVRTGQTVQVVPRTPESLQEVLRLLVDAKSGGAWSRLLNTYSDEEFLEECGRDFDGLVDKCALPPWFAMKPSGSKYKRSAK